MALLGVCRHDKAPTVCRGFVGLIDKSAECLLLDGADVLGLRALRTLSDLELNALVLVE